jgi:1-pyrroline-5-carboxylate dehydrogenase
MAGEKQVEMAIRDALEAKCKWMTPAWIERSAIMIKGAGLISHGYWYLFNAATMLSHGKDVHRAEIVLACRIIDYLKFNTYFASLMHREL